MQLLLFLGVCYSGEAAVLYSLRVTLLKKRSKSDDCLLSWLRSVGNFLVFIFLYQILNKKSSYFSYVGFQILHIHFKPSKKKHRDRH